MSTFSQTTSSFPPPPEYTDDDAKALFSPRFSPPSYFNRLPLPLCVPQLSAGIESTFTRAYSPALNSSGIDLTDWLRFTDGLNIAFNASPPLRVVDAAGAALGLVPYHWAMIAGALMQVGSRTASRGVSNTLTDRYIRNANETYFAPRGLRVRLCRTAAMRQLIGLDARPTQPPNQHMETAKAVGMHMERVGLSLPIVRKIITRLHPAPPVDINGPYLDPTTRRTAQLVGYALPLTYDVPPAQAPAGVINQMGGLGVKLSQLKESREQAKMAATREQLAAAQRGGYDRNGWMQQAGMTEREMRKARKDDDSEKDAKKLRMQVSIADRKEATVSQSLLWIVVINEEQDQQISGAGFSNNRPNVGDIDDYDVEGEFDREYGRDSKRGPYGRQQYDY